ncbi:hypothetical protein ZWY2020_035408 [Hordeum vulgare]|nr:hypothetical protein ZWY2020_035408 [Hordeum vulgare]
MGMAAADAGDPGGEEHLLPTVPPLLGDNAVPPQLRHSPCRRKAASMEALVSVEGGEHGGSEDLIPAFLSLPSDRMEASPKPPSPRRLKAINMAAADRLQLGGIQDLLRASSTLLSNQMEEAHPMASMTTAPNHLSLKRPATVAEEQDVHDDEPIANYKRQLRPGEGSGGGSGRMGTDGTLYSLDRRRRVAMAAAAAAASLSRNSTNGFHTVVFQAPPNHRAGARAVRCAARPTTAPAAIPFRFRRRVRRVAKPRVPPPQPGDNIIVAVS